MNKMTINENRFNELLNESIYEVLQEAEMDERLGHALGQLYQGAKDRWNRFKNDFTAGRNATRYNHKDWDSYDQYQNADDLRNFNGNAYGNYRYANAVNRNSNATQYKNLNQAVYTFMQKQKSGEPLTDNDYQSLIQTLNNYRTMNQANTTNNDNTEGGQTTNQPQNTNTEIGQTTNQPQTNAETNPDLNQAQPTNRFPQKNIRTNGTLRNQPTTTRKKKKKNRNPYQFKRQKYQPNTNVSGQEKMSTQSMVNRTNNNFDMIDENKKIQKIVSESVKKELKKYKKY